MALATDPAKPGNTSTAAELRLARLLTRHSQAEVAKALGVDRSTVSRWEAAEREAPAGIVDWLRLNRSQSFSPGALSKPGEPRGAGNRPQRAREQEPLTSLVAKAAERKP